MMKKLMLIGSLIAVCASASASPFTFVAADKSEETKLCALAVSNQLKALKKSLRRYGDYGLTHTINAIKCNDQSLAKFAHNYYAVDTFTYLNKRSHNSNRVNARVTISDIAQASIKPITVYISAAPN